LSTRRGLAATSTGTIGAGLSEGAARWGLPPAAVTGVRAAALSTGASTVVATVFAATLGIVGSLGFAASEARLAGDPELWGWTFDAVVGDGNDPEIGTRADDRFADDPTVDAYSVVHDIEVASVRSGDRSADVNLAALEPRRGAIQPAMLEGSPPAGEHDVALGGATARRLGVGVGDEVHLEVGGGPAPFTVSGLAVMNLAYDAERIGEGALVTPAGLEAAGGEPNPAFVLVDLVDGVDPGVAYAALRQDWGSTVLRPIRASDVERLHAVRQLPVWFSALVAVVAAVTLAFVLTLTIRRRRRDLALLRTLGFDRRQLRSTVAVQAAALVLPAAVAGALIGVAGGRVAWTATVQGLGAPLVQVTPLGALALVIAGSLLVALVVALAPARFAALTRPAQVLRTE
jgi:putative ABC transport system permease protein